ncbi:MAG TPA: alpha/beta hydrolase [Solirubrobacteraceae bacterium]|nr:alpha/beta hydrolase [Solirubrobacteraceae bacterium]
MTATVEGAGVQLSYRECGAGRTAVLMVHGIGADAARWDPVQQALEDSARTIAYDRRGYGASGAPDPYERTTAEEQAEDAASLLRALDAAPAVLCGENFGALVCLDLLKRHADLALGAVLIDPPLFMFVGDATRALGAERALLEGELRERGPEAAVRAWLEASGESRERAARGALAHRAFFADYGGLTSWPVARAELRAISVPLVVADGPHAAAHQRAASDALAELSPRARREGAGDPVTWLRELVAAVG